MMGRTMVPDGAMSVLQATGNRITYRQLDYWLRTGQITIKAQANGSGSDRKFTEAEKQALAEMIDEIESIQRCQEEIRSGRFYARRLALAEGNTDALHTEEIAADCQS